MKKALSLVLVFLCLLAMIPSALAADTATYEIPELNMKIDIPAEWITFSRNVEEDDPNLQYFSKSAKEFEDYYEQNNIYLNAIRLDPLTEIVITMIEDDNTKKIYDFSTLTESELKKNSDEFMKNLSQAAAGISFETPSFYKHAMTNFIAVDFINSNINAHGREYSTYINGQCINITLLSYTGEITDDMAQIIKKAVDSITFTKITKNPNAGINWTRVAYTGLIGAVAGGIIATVGVLIRKKRKSKFQNTAQVYPGQSYPGQSYPGQSYPGQSYPGQSYPGQSYPGQSYPGQNYPGQSYSGQSYPGQSYSGQSYPGQSYPGPTNTEPGNKKQD